MDESVAGSNFLVVPWQNHHMVSSGCGLIGAWLLDEKSQTMEIDTLCQADVVEPVLGYCLMAISLFQGIRWESCGKFQKLII